MKYLTLILIVGLVFFVLGLKRARPSRPSVPDKPAPRPAPAAPAGAQDIVACAECGLHVPRSEALPGRGGHFCSAAHRSAFEGRSAS